MVPRSKVTLVPVMLAPALTLCVPPLNRSVPPVALNGPVCVLVPLPEKESVPLVMLTDPVLLKTTPTVAVPKLTVRLKVPWLLNMLPVPEFAIVLSFWISKLPEAWLLKMAPLANVRALVATLIVAAPELLRVRPSRVLVVAPGRSSVPPDAIVVTPDPLIVPLVQLRAPLTVRFPLPVEFP